MTKKPYEAPQIIKETDTDEHESYGLVGFSRRNGSGTSTMFGSSIRDHMTTIVLTIKRGKREHDLSKDWYYSREQLIEVELTQAQFSELLTTMNMGDGVPCTIRSINGERVENPPDTLLEAERIRDDFKASSVKLCDSVEDLMKNAETILGKKHINNTDKKEIVGIFTLIRRKLKSDMPFVADQFQRATDKLVSSAKAEVDGFVTSIIARTGLKQLTKMTGAKLQELPAVKDEDKEVDPFI